MRDGVAETVHAQNSLSRAENSISKLLVVVYLLSPTLSLLNGCAGVVTANSKQTATPASLRLSSTSISFGSVSVGKQATQTVSVSNSGSVPLNITQMALSSSEFRITGATTPLALAVGQTTSFAVTMKATTAGTVTGTLTVTGDSGSIAVVANLTATAVSGQAQLSLGQSAVNFGTVSVGSKGNSTLTLNNLGGADLTVSMVSMTGTDFAISGITTPKTISAGQSAQATVTFTPATAGSANGSISIISNDPTNSTMTVSLSGTGSSTASGQLSASPSSVSFGTVAVGSSANKQIVLSNSGTAAIKISSVAVSGNGYKVNGVTAPVTINPSATVTLTATFAPSAAATDSGSITVTSNASNSSLAIALSGTAAQAGLAVSPATFNFGSIVEGQTKSQSFTVTNTGSAALTIAQIGESGNGFTVSGLTTPATIAAGGSATLSVLFAPTAAGSLTGSVSIASNAPNSPNAVSLSGTGVAASVTLSANPTSLAFGGWNAGSSSSKSLTITNSGNSSLTISHVTVNAKDFAASGMTTPVTLGAGQQASLNVSFSPTSSENVTGNVTVTSSQGVSAVIPLSGSGLQPALSVNPGSATFGNATVGNPSSQTIQLSNSGTGTLSITQVAVTGSGFSSSSLSLPISLSTGQTSNFNVQFSPVSAGAVTGSVSIVTNAPGSPVLIPLSGTGVPATLTLSFSSTSLGFGNVNTGSSSSLPVTVTNSGNSVVQISSITETGSGFTLSGASAPVTLSSSQSLTFNVSFSPSAAGSDSGTVTVSSNATGSPTAISLSGTGVQAANHSVALNWTASTSTVSGYNVYRSTTNGSGYSKINGSLVSGVSYSDTAVQNGTTYYYVTTAVDSSGNESTDSNQATAVIP
jgi:HYDIN/CFA65/VesB-like, Ig-like domain/Cep192 domain 4/Abnormal spindle-like microcephaly-assoc'd, ASPM-SPD-2-Hydin